MLTILYFARVREGVGRDSEQIDLAGRITTAAHLANMLGHAALRDRAGLRVAIDQQLADWDADVTHAREVAFFPPVTGG